MIDKKVYRGYSYCLTKLHIGVNVGDFLFFCSNYLGKFSMQSKQNIDLYSVSQKKPKAVGHKYNDILIKQGAYYNAKS